MIPRPHGLKCPVTKIGANPAGMFYAFPQRTSKRETTAVNHGAALGPWGLEREAAAGSQEALARATARTVGR